MWRSMIKVAAATAAFAAVHSLLASRGAKRAAASALGERNRNGLYRVAYMGQSLATFGLLAAYIRRQPGRELYRVEGAPAILLRVAQAGALVYVTAAARQIGVLRVSGVESFAHWLGDGPVPPEPEAQGPALDAEGKQRAAGPFAWSRHPLNFAPVILFWLAPKMTTNHLAFSAAATAYLVLGSWHEEARLRQAYGAEYTAYQNSDAQFYLPRLGRSGREPLEQLLPPVNAAEATLPARLARPAGDR